MSVSTSTMADLAILMGLCPVSAVALPAAISNASRKVGYTEAEFVSACFAKPALREYVAAACRTALKAVAV